MTSTEVRDVVVKVEPAVGLVSAILMLPPDPRWLYILAHGAGAGMRHPFLENISRALADRGVATLRYQFPYMENGTRYTDAPPVCEATVLCAVHAAGREAPSIPLVAGGKSFGGRMTAYTASDKWLPGVRGLAFLGFPLHAPRKPSVTRAKHLDAVQLPMLFIQGTRDAFADPVLLRQVLDRLGKRATLHEVEGGDHSFATLKRSGRTEAAVFAELADALDEWAVTVLHFPRRSPPPVTR